LADCSCGEHGAGEQTISDLDIGPRRKAELATMAIRYRVKRLPCRPLCQSGIDRRRALAQAHSC
jgi:hypothetical protein